MRLIYTSQFFFAFILYNRCMEFIKKVLMCRPLHYSVEYIINPWMKPNSVDPKKAMQQWNNLVSIYQSLGIDVEIIDQ